MSAETDQKLYLKSLSSYVSTDTLSSISSIPTTIQSSLLYLTTLSISDKFKFNLDWNWNWNFPTIWHWQQQDYSKITDDLKASISKDEFSIIIAHVNNYIDILVTERLKQQKEEIAYSRISPHVAIEIGTIVKEHIINYKYLLTDADCERIAQIVLARLRNEKKLNDAENHQKLFVLSQENLDEITGVVKQQIEIHNHLIKSNEHVDNSDAPANIDIDEIIYKVLTSKQLESIIEKNISPKTIAMTKLIDEQNSQIELLRNEIDGIKLERNDIVNENFNIRVIIQQIQANHDQLKGAFDLSQKQNDEKFELLLNEIDEKLSNLSEKQFIAINQHIKKVIAGILGYKSTASDESLDDVDITNWIRNVFVAKQLLEERLIELETKFNQSISKEISQAGIVLIGDITKVLEVKFLCKLNENNEQFRADISSHINTERFHGNLDDEQIRRIVKEALAIYDADKTGMVDFALESAGGEVLSTRCTENYHQHSAQISVFGIPLWYKANTPRIVITPSVHPGDCWAFRGFPGYLVLRLNSNVYVTGFTIEHIPKSLSTNGRIDSAPKLFTVMGILTENDPEPYVFGEYEFVENGTSLQYFPVKNTDENTRPFNLVELRIESNHGHMNYTCLYRFRVHGTIDRDVFRL